MTREEALQLIYASTLADMAEQLEQFLVPSVRLRAVRVQASQLPLGASQLGGVPDWPAATPWPHVHDRPLSFIAQIRLADLDRLLGSDGLRLNGWLYFFYDVEEQVWGSDLEDRDHWHVVHLESPLDDLDRAVPPTMPEDCQFRLCSLRFELEHTLAESGYVCGTLEREFTGEQHVAYGELFERINGTEEETRHRMFGLPDEIQGDMRLSCERCRTALRHGDLNDDEYPRDNELDANSCDWVLLLQVDSDDDGPGWMWGDCGRLYFWIREQDLEAANFDQVWMILQCY